MLLAARKGAGQLTFPLEQARKNSVNSLDLRSALCLSASGERAKLEIFPDRHPGEEPTPLRNESDTALDDPLRRHSVEALPLP